MIYNWIIAVLGLIIFYLLEMQKDKVIFGTKEVINWYKKHWVRLWLSAISVIVLMMMFVTKPNVDAINDYLSKYPIFKVIYWDKIASFIIGVLNVWILKKIMKKSKNEIDKKTK